MKYLFTLALCVLLCRGHVHAQQEGQRPVHTLYLIGDAGEPEITESTAGRVLRRLVTDGAVPATVVFLGDNIYPRGMPGADEPYRATAEDILKAQAEWLNDLPATGIFIPGNHDWDKGGRFGFQRVLNQQAFLDSLKLPGIRMLPGGGCPDPVEVPLTENTLLVIIDSQWLLHPWEKPGPESGCEVESGAELALALADIYRRNARKRIVLAGHHPVLTHGAHGGQFNWKDHLFPLTHASDDLYLPLPVIGSVFPLYRKWFGNVQDVAHPMYKAYSTSLRMIMAAYPGSVHAAGHEHSLQYINEGNSYFIVSGAGVKDSFVRPKDGSLYAAARTGFVQVDIMRDGELHIRYWHVDEAAPDGVEAFRDTLRVPARFNEQPRKAEKTFLDTVVVTKASEQYAAKPWRKKMLGANYRDVWQQEIPVRVFDLDSEKGGLSIVKKGGGMQTLSLRLQDSVGREYALRSVEKYPEAAVPEMFRKTFAQDLVQDQISSAHPYGALIVPPMAEAAGVYHTNPELVYIPDDPRLGIYRDDFRNTLALFEERPDGDWSHASYFGGSEKIVGTDKVLEKLKEDNDHRIDQPFVVKSRLFDFVIGDWDRHDDQWRWASYDKKKGNLYRPIPRDRDQAFFVNEGVLPKLWSRKWSLPKFEGFNDEMRWPSGFSFNARYFDRTFITEPDREIWISAARELQEALTDSVIEAAARRWPEEIYKLHGDVIIRKLKSRRDRLVDYAVAHYTFLAKEVDVVTSDKHEAFVVDRLADGHVHVTVYKIDKKRNRDKVIYDRLFDPAETKEIRLYGRGGDDVFELSGEASRSIVVRIIGGEGEDTVNDQSAVRSLGRRTYFYDHRKGSSIQSSGELKVMTSNDPAVNAYDRRTFQYNRLAPLVYGNFNVDDGLFIGGGFLYQRHGFRKFPFRSQHLAVASIAPRTNSYNFLYRGDFIGVIKRWDLEINADLKVPNFVNNFFGWGNESVFDQSIDEQPGIDADNAIDYYRFRFEEIRLEALLTRRIGAHARVKLGPAYQRIELEEPDEQDRYVYGYAESLPYDLFNEFNSYAGIQWALQLSQRDDAVLTRRGIEAQVNGRTMQALSALDVDYHFSSFNGSVSFFHTFQFPGRLVFALRAGGGINTGTYEFYQAQILDGRTEMRGFRKTRFYGDSKLYTNFEMRLKLLNLRTYLFPVSMGILGFHDLGRVWYKDEQGMDPTADGGSSSVWHRSWGGGLWFTPFNLAVLSTELGHSREGNLFYLRLGFLF